MSDYFGFGGVGNDPGVMTFSLGDTVTPELPNYSTGPDYVGTSAQVEVSNIPRSDSGNIFGGFLNGVSATADSLLGVWGKYNQIEDTLAANKFNREVTTAKTSLLKTQTLGTLDLQKAQVEATLAIEKARTQASVANDMAKINSGGSMTLSKTLSPFVVLGGLFALGAAAYYMRKGK